MLHEHGIDVDVIVGAKTKIWLSWKRNFPKWQAICILQQMTDLMEEAEW